MSNELVIPVKSGVRVLVVAQYEFAVDGVEGQTLAVAAGVSCFCRAVAIEEGARAYSAVVKLRQRKTSDLSDLLAIVSGTYAKYEVTAPKDQKYTTANLELTDYNTFKTLMKRLGIATYDWNDGSTKIPAASLDKIRTDVEYHVQRETADLQSDIVILQNYMQKRDSAYSTASTMMSKVNSSISSSIGYILG